MSTLDRVKSAELFYRIKEVGNRVSHLAGVVQNPDFVNENNARENYEVFVKEYGKCIEELHNVAGEVKALHKELLK